MENINRTDNDDMKTTYKSYIEFNESLGEKRENVNLDEKSEIVKISKPKSKTKIKSLDKAWLIDMKFPTGYTFSIAGKKQIENIKEFATLFTFSIKICDCNNKELSPDSRLLIHKEKDINEYETDVIRLESILYKDVSITKFCKESPDSIKTIDDIYKFRQGIEFNEDEHLRIYIVDPNIDIDNVEFNINLDKWKHD